VSGVAGRLASFVPASLAARLPVEVRAELRDRLGLEVPGDLAYRPTPPALRPGEQVGPPDIVVVGGPATGSRWWAECLADHPQVAPTGDLDGLAHLFARFATDGFGADEAAEVHACFPRRPGQRVVHWSPDGLAYPWVAPVLVRAAPEARVVVLVGDPVDGVLADLERTDALRPPHPGTWLADSVDRGFASEHLARLLTVVPADQVLVLQAERCAADPAGQLARTLAFAGLDPAERTVGVTPAHPGGAPRAVDAGVLERLRRLYADEVVRLAALVPDLDLALWATTVA